MSLVLDFGEAGHRRTELDLPWLVNGTLDALARERVVQRQPFFRSTVFERRMLFARAPALARRSAA